MNEIIWLILGLGIILALAIYAGLLLLKLKKQKQFQKEELQQKQRLQVARDLKVFSSVELISKAMSEKQCDISEGSWRLAVLIQSLPEYSEPLMSEFPAIFNLYSKIKHMPILDARTELSKKQRLKFDLERMGVEQEYETAIYQEVAKLTPKVASIQGDLKIKLQ